MQRRVAAAVGADVGADHMENGVELTANRSLQHPGRTSPQCEHCVVKTLANAMYTLQAEPGWGMRRNLQNHPKFYDSK